MSLWYSRWRIKINKNKSIYLTFTLRQRQPPSVSLNSELISHSDTVKYWSLLFDKRLTWAKHIHITRLSLNWRLALLRHIFDKSSKLNLKSKISIYNLLLKPIWTHGVQLWSIAKKSNIKKIQIFQSKILRLITNAPYYVSNGSLHTVLPTIKEVTKIHYQ